MFFIFLLIININFSVKSFDDFYFYHVSGSLYDYGYGLGKSEGERNIIFFCGNSEIISNYSYVANNQFNIKFPNIEYSFIQSLKSNDLWDINVKNEKIGEIKSKSSSDYGLKININIYKIDYLINFEIFKGTISIERPDKKIVIKVLKKIDHSLLSIVPTLKINEIINIFLGLYFHSVFKDQ